MPGRPIRLPYFLPYLWHLKRFRCLANRSHMHALVECNAVCMYELFATVCYCLRWPNSLAKSEANVLAVWTDKGSENAKVVHEKARLWARLARAAEAVAGIPVAGAHPGSAELPRTARRALRRHRGRVGGRSLPRRGLLTGGLLTGDF